MVPNIILEGLMSGAAVAAKDTVSTAVKDAYGVLKAKLVERFAGRPEAGGALLAVERGAPEARSLIEQNLLATGAGTDGEIIEAARALLHLIDRESKSDGKFRIHVAGNVENLIQGNQAVVNIRTKK